MTILAFLSLVRRGSLAIAMCATFVRAAEAPQPLSWETPPGWTETRGGADGRIVRVTTLAPQGPGSLAEALMADGPRVIEFAIAGAIDLGGRTLNIVNPNLTVAGETAPAPGITCTNGEIHVSTHDVIFRHIKIRPGAGNRAKRSGWEADGLSTGGGAYDVIIDHCSLTWATDENLSASGPQFKGGTPDEWRKNTSHRVTFSHCIIGEALDESTHSKGSHSMGSLVHDNVSEIAIIGNLYISNNDRNPLFKGGVRAAFVNNVVHNPGERVVQFGYVPKQWEGREPQRALLTMAGNVARKGPSSAPKFAFFEVWPAYGPCDFYLSDNLFFDVSGKPLAAEPGFRSKADLRDDFKKSVPTTSGYEYRQLTYQPTPEMRRVENPPIWPPRLKALPASEVTAWVLTNAGARPWERDAIDRRLIEEARSSGGKIINFESEAGGLAQP